HVVSPVGLRLRVRSAALAGAHLLPVPRALPGRDVPAPLASNGWRRSAAAVRRLASARARANEQRADAAVIAEPRVARATSGRTSRATIGATALTWRRTRVLPR